MNCDFAAVGQQIRMRHPAKFLNNGFILLHRLHKMSERILSPFIDMFSWHPNCLQRSAKGVEMAGNVPSPLYVKRNTSSVPHSLCTAMSDDVFHVVVEMLDGKYETIDIDPEATVGELKGAIELATNVYVESQRLLVGDRELLDTATLAESKLNSGDSVHLVVRARGGATLASFQFADVTSPGQRIELVDTAPEWRTVCRGLNLEGVCENRDCRAFKQKVVVRVGFRVNFDVGTERLHQTCPIVRSSCLQLKLLE